MGKKTVVMEELLQGRSIQTEIDEQIVFNQLDGDVNAVWRNGKAFIFAFKVLDPDEDEETLEDTLANAHAQIEEKRYEAELIAAGFAPEQIRKYGFAFQGKKCLIG